MDKKNGPIIIEGEENVDDRGNAVDGGSAGEQGDPEETEKAKKAYYLETVKDVLFTSDDPYVTHSLSNAYMAQEMGNQEEADRYFEEAADAYRREVEGRRDQGEFRSFDDEEIAEIARREIEDNLSERLSDKQAEHESAETQRRLNQERARKTVFSELTPNKMERKVVSELTPNEMELSRVFIKSQEKRGELKDPGNPRYRMMSVAAVELSEIDQPDEPSERTKKLNAEIERASKEAFGDVNKDSYAGDTVAGVQAYISETLIGDDADHVFIGTTETIVNGQGQIGKNNDVYGNLVVIRWTKNNVNHVFAFSPKKDFAFYALVDDSMGDSWRDTFINAGSFNGEDRKRVIASNHVDHSEFFHHEISLEKATSKILQEEGELIESGDLVGVDRMEARQAISERYARFAHVSTPGKYVNKEAHTENFDERDEIEDSISDYSEHEKSS